MFCHKTVFLRTKNSVKDYAFFLSRTKKVLIKTTVIELIGISIAAINGLKFPEIAKESPTTL